MPIQYLYIPDSADDEMRYPVSDDDGNISKLLLDAAVSGLDREKELPSEEIDNMRMALLLLYRRIRQPMPGTVMEDTEADEKSADALLLRAELRRWQRASLRAIKTGALADCQFDTDAIPGHWQEWIHAQLSKCAESEQVKRLFLTLKQFIPKAGGPLPPLPDKVEITEDDIDAAIKHWDDVMGPEFAGLLDATVEGR